MDETAAAAATTETATPATQAPAKPESLSEQMERLGWDPKEKHDANPNALGAKAREAQREAKPGKKSRADKPAPTNETAPTAPTDAGVAAVVETAAEKVDPLAPKREQLKQLAVELGLMLEDGRVTSKERAEIRLARKQLQEQLTAREQEAVRRIEAATRQLEERESGLSPKAQKVADFEAAVASGDHEAIAKVMGFDSYDAWQEHVIALKQDPAYKRLRALEQQAAEREKSDRERQEQERAMQEQRAQHEEQQRAQAAQHEARRVYMADLTGKMAASEDPIVKAMADDPAFVGAVFRVQQENWDGGGVVMRPEDAIRKPARGATQSLHGQLEMLYKKLSPIFGSAQAATARPAVSKPPQAQRSTTPGAPKPPPPSVKKMDDREWKRSAAARLSEAAREESIERRGRRTA